MAVVDVYANALYTAGIATKMLPAINSTGCELHFIRESVTVGASDSNTSKYRVFKNLDPSIRPQMILVTNSANTSGTDWDLGLYSGNGEFPAAISAGATNCFADALDMSAAALLPIPGVAKNGMKDVAHTSNAYNKQLWEYAGVTDVKNRPGSYEMVLTANVVGTDGGVITVSMYFTLN